MCRMALGKIGNTWSSYQISTIFCAVSGRCVTFIRQWCPGEIMLCLHFPENIRYRQEWQKSVMEIWQYNSKIHFWMAAVASSHLTYVVYRITFGFSYPRFFLSSTHIGIRGMFSNISAIVSLDEEKSIKHEKWQKREWKKRRKVSAKQKLWSSQFLITLKYISNNFPLLWNCIFRILSPYTCSLLVVTQFSTGLHICMYELRVGDYATILQSSSRSESKARYKFCWFEKFSIKIQKFIGRINK